MEHKTLEGAIISSFSLFLNTPLRLLTATTNFFFSSFLLHYPHYPPEVMSPRQASSDDFPRLIGAENFDVWKARVCAAFDGKHLLGIVKQLDYDGVSEEESEDSTGGMSDDDGPPAKATKDAEVDSDAVDYAESDDELKPPSDSDDDSGASSDGSIKRKDLPAVRPFNSCEASRTRKRPKKEKSQPLSQRERRRQEAFLQP
ncbi:hypothetical protein P3T76_008300 [Phytophthora citrophthora]|uniref:Retrotransposon Copia-like N-terminal domain-containing protein n=1 Tax=Phytophthora citrophthora TaxID=4793 RepID=A0AAD9GK45_9STRA|nr:hypothetical protein P3T76_008300 [Phytophthora citrophthora]